MEKITPLEEINPELANFFIDIANKRLSAVVDSERVFLKVKDKLFEIEADIPGRNDLCICGSGKKFKKCCIDKI